MSVKSAGDAEAAGTKLYELGLKSTLISLPFTAGVCVYYSLRRSVSDQCGTGCLMVGNVSSAGESLKTVTQGQ